MNFKWLIENNIEHYNFSINNDNIPMDSQSNHFVYTIDGNIMAHNGFLILKEQNLPYMNQAIDNGIAGWILDKELWLAYKHIIDKHKMPTIVIDNLNGMIEQWCYNILHQQWIIGVTGSAGKTTVTKNIAHYLNQYQLVNTNFRNYNTLEGLKASILSTPLNVLSFNEYIHNYNNINHLKNNLSGDNTPNNISNPNIVHGYETNNISNNISNANVVHGYETNLVHGYETNNISNNISNPNVVHGDETNLVHVYETNLVHVYETNLVHVYETNLVHVYEMGISHPNDMNHLLTLVRPKIVILLPINFSHSANFDSLDELIGEKIKIINENTRLVIGHYKYKTYTHYHCHWKNIDELIPPSWRWNQWNPPYIS